MELGEELVRRLSIRYFKGALCVSYHAVMRMSLIVHVSTKHFQMSSLVCFSELPPSCLSEAMQVLRAPLCSGFAGCVVSQ